MKRAFNYIDFKKPLPPQPLNFKPQPQKNNNEILKDTLINVLEPYLDYSTIYDDILPKLKGFL